MVYVKEMGREWGFFFVFWNFFVGKEWEKKKKKECFKRVL